ncbi:phospholipid phosphatase 2-like isoform X3 [Cylas formicarius]|uniref:phospholipid phosphatase 2-like isoform X3 n=1 Tax=Cylas formicarius TaxID=197179 RepID=UPI00295892C6|nr:phospholipid phosphatase 2-like isoform X3 [Cylas formicarius]
MMNNVYAQKGEFYGSTGNMCFDNKGMVTPAHSERAAPQPIVRINITDPDKTATTEKATARLRLRQRFRLPYAINSLICVVVLSCLILLEFGFIPGFKSGFYCQDPSLSHPYTGDTISTSVLLIGNLLVIPLFVLFFTEYIRKGSPSNVCITELWYFYKEFLTGCALVLLLTEVGKVLIGEHRPNFFDVCQPHTAANCSAGSYVTTYECRNNKFGHYFLTDTSRSFPSGHSSLSVFVALYQAYIIQTRLPTVKTGRLFKPFSVSLLVIWSLVCSLTRISDKRHHWWDVAAGMLLGAMCVVYSVSIIHKKLLPTSIPRVACSTTTLLDVKNKDARSEII